VQHLDRTQTSCYTAQVVLSFCIPLCSGKAVQFNGLCIVARNTFAFLKRSRQRELRVCFSLRQCKAEESHGLYTVLRNTKTVKIHILAK
jgi:hypothetical protein